MTASMTCRIRRAVPGDARGIARVHVETWRSAYAGILPDRVIVQMSVDEKAAAWRQLVQRQDQVEAVIVAETDDGTIIGFASCGPSSPEGMADYDGEIHTLYVLPDWQEQGIGRALLCGCFRVLAAAEIAAAYLWVLADNPSRFFYQAMGGQRIGEREERLWGTAVNEIAYGWPDLTSLPEACRGFADER
jgi:ribosomal protein S18 acetylase RimI-like enzyme